MKQPQLNIGMLGSVSDGKSTTVFKLSGTKTQKYSSELKRNITIKPGYANMKIYNNKKPFYDLFFAMSHGVHRGVLKKGKFDERAKIINYLIKKNPHLKFNIFGMNNIQPIWGDEFKYNLYNSKIALNLSQGKPLKYYSSDRIAQLMGNGIATLIDKKTKLNNFFSDKEAIFYNSIDDLNKKLNFMLKKNKLRNDIAKNGRNKYHRYYNSTIIADYMISKIFNLDKKFNW